MNPSVVEAKVIVFDTGHDGPTNARDVKILEVIDLIKKKKDMLSLDINVAENNIIRYAREAVPGIVLTVSIIYKVIISYDVPSTFILGMELAEIDSAPRMVYLNMQVSHLSIF